MTTESEKPIDYQEFLKKLSPNQREWIKKITQIYNPPTKEQMEKQRLIFNEKFERFKKLLPSTNNTPPASEQNHKSQQLIFDSNELNPSQPDVLGKIHKDANNKFTKPVLGKIWRQQANREKRKRKGGWGKYRNLTREQLANNASRFERLHNRTCLSPEEIIINRALCEAEEQDRRNQNSKNQE
jgi:hypothetical protein